jgi:hydrogenase maturation protein HypF
VLPARFPDVAGLGAELKSTFCFVKENVACLSQHLGDLDHPLVRDYYADTFGFFHRFLEAHLAAVCRDLHPGYFTTGFAERVPARRHLALQHHKAHLYALLAESRFSGRAVGVSFDGTGYGEDGTIWGGEFFRIDGMEMERAGSLLPFPLQGGDSSVKEPWKTALALLHETLGKRDAETTALRLLDGVPGETISLVSEAIARKVNVVPTSSAGRLFDGVAALSGVCRRVTYEGQAAMLLEGAVRRGGKRAPYDFTIRDGGERLTVDWTETIAAVVSDVLNETPAAAVAERFHDTVAAMILSAAGSVAEAIGADHVLLSGGVFQNVLLVRRLLSGFRKRKLKAVIHREVPPNDGGISLGQAYYAAHMVAGG